MCEQIGCDVLLFSCIKRAGVAEMKDEVVRYLVDDPFTPRFRPGGKP